MLSLPSENHEMVCFKIVEWISVSITASIYGRVHIASCLKSFSLIKICTYYEMLALVSESENLTQQLPKRCRITQARGEL